MRRAAIPQEPQNAILQVRSHLHKWRLGMGQHRRPTLHVCSRQRHHSGRQAYCQETARRLGIRVAWSNRRHILHHGTRALSQGEHGMMQEMDSFTAICWSHSRGHPVYWDGKTWRYEDGTLHDDSRSCVHCNMPHERDGPDPCLGWLHGVTSACCGHGGVTDTIYMTRKALPASSTTLPGTMHEELT